MDDFTLTHSPHIAVRNLLRNRRTVRLDDAAPGPVSPDMDISNLLGREKNRLHRHAAELMEKERLLLEQTQHRIDSGLEIIARILATKAQGMVSAETRGHLEDTHRRVLAITQIQNCLPNGDQVELAPYLSKLCASLAAAMIGEAGSPRLQTICTGGTVNSADAASFGMIVSELVSNALKYAFPDGKDGALVTVRYVADGGNWNLSVCDNGVGKTSAETPAGGLGASLVAALANKLDARVEMVSSADGMKVSVSHAASTPVQPFA